MWLSAFPAHFVEEGATQPLWFGHVCQEGAGSRFVGLLLGSPFSPTGPLLYGHAVSASTALLYGLQWGAMLTLASLVLSVLSLF